MTFEAELIKQNITKKEHRSTPDVALPDQDTGMVNGLGHASLEDKGLETPCKEVLSSKSKDVIKLVLTLSEKPIVVHAAEQCLTLKDTSWVLLIKRK